MVSYVYDVNSEPSRRGARSLPAIFQQGDYAPWGKMADSWYFSAGKSA